MARKNWLTAVCAAIAVIIAAGVYFYSQEPTSADSRAMVLPVDPTPLVAVTRAGERSFTIEVADEPSERSAGLMFREQMADDHGMLFVFERQQEVGFWMRNTPMPLDLIFIDQDGRIRAIDEGEPQSEAVISPGEPVRFVLELKAGIAAREGIEDGDLVRHPVIGAAPGPSEPPADNGKAPNAGKAG